MTEGGYHGNFIFHLPFLGCTSEQNHFETCTAFCEKCRRAPRPTA